jgi:peroxiredoxin
MKKYALVLFLFLSLIISGCGDAKANNEDNNKNTEEKIGLAKSNIAPDFTLNDMEGNPHTLTKYRGKVVLIDFWATWCPPCVVEIPHFVKLYNEYNEKGFVILGVSLDNDEKKLRDFVSDQAITYPILVNGGQVSTIYAVQAIPTAYLLDKEGKIVKKFVGYRPGYEKDIKKILLGLLKIEDE